MRSLLLPTLALLMFAGNAAAQATAPALLNTVEMQKLMTSAGPGDHARIGAHFTALADRYTAEAKRHTSMSRSFIGNPSRNLGTGMSGHCERLAALNTQSAAAARELATYHQKLGTGAKVTPPVAGARLATGAGAPAPTDQELTALAAKASTPADHRSLSEYFLTLEKRYTSEAADHTAMAASYRGLPRSPAGAAGMAVHCETLARLSRESAKEATEAAAMHKQLAGTAR